MQPLPIQAFQKKKQHRNFHDAEHNLITGDFIWRGTCGNIVYMYTQKMSLAGSLSPAATTWSPREKYQHWNQIGKSQAAIEDSAAS